MDIRKATISDGVVNLRPWTDADVPALTAALQDPEIPRWIPIIPSPYSEDDARGFIDARTATDETPSSASWAIEDTQTKALLGQVGFPQLSLDHKTAEVGYWMVKEHRGRGLCTRALIVLRDWAFGEVGLERLELRTLDGNVASEKVAIKCGFTQEGELRSIYKIRGEQRGMTVWSLLEEGMESSLRTGGFSSGVPRPSRAPSASPSESVRDTETCEERSRRGATLRSGVNRAY